MRRRRQVRLGVNGAELHRRIDVALDSLIDVERAAGDDELDGWLEQARVALLAAGDAARRHERDREFSELDLGDLDRELDELADELEAERYGDEAAT